MAGLAKKLEMHGGPGQPCGKAWVEALRRSLRVGRCLRAWSRAERGSVRCQGPAPAGMAGGGEAGGAESLHELNEMVRRVKTRLKSTWPSPSERKRPARFAHG